MTEFVIMELNEIMTFVDENTKADNDITNKIREKIIANIFDISDDYFSDTVFGSYWVTIRDKLKTALDSLCSIPYHRISITQKGGMKYNYDFVVKYCDINNIVVHSVNLEFKNNNSNIKDLVQFLELYDKDCKDKFGLFGYSYSEYYYDNFLDSYLNIDNISCILKPSKEVYLKNIRDIKYKHPFFNYLYTNKNINKKEKDNLVEESRKQFIQTYSHTFNFEKITQKIIESQRDKVFLLWDKNNFITQRINVETIRISGISSVNPLYFDVSVDNFIYDIRIRLNWGNNNGIANPRWKFSFIYKLVK